MSWFSDKKKKGQDDVSNQNFWPVTSKLSGFGKLTEKDTTWTCEGKKGFQTETQIWYSVMPDGGFMFVQVIWSYTGIFVVPATSQMTFKYFHPHTKKQVWKSINASGFKATGRGCKSDQFEVKHSGTPEGEESYAITANLDKNVQLSVTFTRPAEAPGFKYGDGPEGGFSYLGKDPAEGKRDGLVVHRFHGFTHSAGHITLDGQAIDVAGGGIFIHAIQGMRPDSLASRWNFCFFTSGGGQEESKLGTVRAVQMEVQTTDSYGPKGAKSGRTKVNVGAIYSSVAGTPLVVVGQTHVAEGGSQDVYTAPNNDISMCTQSNHVKDKFTGYDAPGAIEFKWEGDSLQDKSQRVSGLISVDKLGITEGEGGLMEKVDVLAEIPVLVRKALAAATGTKPYIYQYMNPTTLNLKIGEETIPVKGWVFNEASFVSP